MANTGSPSDAPLPRLRQDLRIMAAGNGLLVEDPVQRKRIRLGPEGSRVLNAASAPAATPGSMVRDLDRITPARALEHLIFLVQQHLFDDARWQAQRPLYEAALAEPMPEVTTLPLRWHPALRHACVACGSSCHGTDIGPVPGTTVDAVRDHQLWEQVPGLTGPEGAFVETTFRGEAMRLMARSPGGTCTMLGGDRLCLIHAAAGAGAKPGICRQFPYTYMRGRDAVWVGLNLECRSLLQARERARSTRDADHEGELRAQLAGGAVFTDVPDPVPLAPGLAVSPAEYLALEEKLLAAVSGGSQERPPEQRWREVATLIRSEVRRRDARWSGREPYLETEAWRSMGRPWMQEEQPSDSQAARTDLLNLLASDVEAWRDEARAEGQLPRVARADLFASAARVAAGTPAVEAPYWNGPEGPDVLQTMLLAELWGKEPLRHADLSRGVAEVGLKLDLVQALARFRAFGVSRLPLFGQDAVDAVVTVSKMMRESVVKARLARRSGSVRWGWCAPDSGSRERWMSADRSG